VSFKYLVQLSNSRKEQKSNVRMWMSD